MNSPNKKGNKNQKSTPNSPVVSKDTNLIAVTVQQGGSAKNKGKGKVYMNPKSMRDYKLSVDDAITIQLVSNNTTKKIAIACVWPAEVRIGNLEVDQTILTTIGGDSGCSIRVASLSYPIVNVNKIIVTHINENAEEVDDKLNTSKVPVKELLGSFLLSNLAGRFVKENDIIDITIYTNQHSFVINSIITNNNRNKKQPLAEREDLQSVNGKEKLEAYYVTYNTLIELSNDKNLNNNNNNNNGINEKNNNNNDSLERRHIKDSNLSYDCIGGLENELAIIREIIELPLKHPQVFYHFGLKPPRGVLLYGPPGTGKTLIAKVVANELGCFVYTINGSDIYSKYLGESEEKLREVFELAQANAPSLIFIDEIDVLAPQRQDEVNSSSKRVVGTLLSLMDGMKQSDRVVILASTNQPNSIDIALRRAGRFDREVEIGIPTKQARLSILNIYLRNMPHDLSEDEIKTISENTHGYVGADMSQLCKQAALQAIREATNEIKEDSIIDKLEKFESQLLKEVKVHFNHFCLAINEIRPSGMREILVEIPSVRWNDIGGYDKIKQQLLEAVDWPIKFPEKFIDFGIRPPRGILLYGPPGCSKTLIAKAIATEAGLNFLPVKGPELFSKFVGESERAIREIFRKARLASPSIIFFDEIDALAISRGKEGSVVQDRVLSQLLNELDGISPLNNVLFLCATNRPDIIVFLSITLLSYVLYLVDKALMRPGRIDRILYIPPPDIEARLKILQLTIKKMKVDQDVNITTLSEKTESYSGAEIVQLCHEAAMIALRNNINATTVTMEDFVSALKVVLPRTSSEQIRYYNEFSNTSSGGLNPFQFSLKK